MSKKSDSNASQQSGSRIAALLASVFRFRFWLDVERVRGFTQYLVALAKRMFVPQPPKKGESFADAIARLNLTNEDLAKREQALLRVSYLMLFFAVMLFGYSIYQMVDGSILGVILSLIVTCIALALTFRYHFWYFQIKTKKLGCSWRVWLNEGLLGGKKS